MKADVQNFYRSVYTHSIPWALHTKPVAKANIGHNATQILAGNVLDLHVRSAQDGQTIGIPIGTDVSWLLGELIMVAVEKRLLAAIPGLRGYRYIDDFEIACETAAQSEKVLGQLEEALAEFELSLNPRKTLVVPLPARLESEGLAELRMWNFGADPQRQTRDVLAYFDRLTDLRSDDPETSTSSYGIARLQGVPWHPDVWLVVQSCVAAFILNEPSVLESTGKLLATGAAQSLPVDVSTLETVLNSVIGKCAPLRRDSEMAWATWLAIEHGVTLDQQACKLLSGYDDSFVALLAILAEQRGYCKNQLDHSAWHVFMVEDELKGPHWLLSYEARQQSWLGSRGGGDHRDADPFFRDVKSAGVSFLNFSAKTQPSYAVQPGTTSPAGSGSSTVGAGYG